MFKQIDKDSKIFESEEYLKDKYKFYIILKNLQSPTLELYSDEKNYIICRGKIDLPIWIWTKDDFDKNVAEEIENTISTMLVEESKTKLTCKKELYDLLVKRKYNKLDLNDYFEMGFLICRKTKEPKKCDGVLSIPTLNDLDIIADYFYNDHLEMNGVDSITKDEARQKAIEYINSNKFYVLRNHNNKIVCMAGYNTVEEQAKINAVYTPKEERKKGYAANLIYLMSNDILSKGLIPLLYTDYNYVASNKAYKNAGYEDTGILINFSCSKSQ
ncbi:MAG: GNAT family N-acetyltransferase [Clostridia bacterium]|nr:GNAT family N-acetyltransferase [Clostridia bacterium]